MFDPDAVLQFERLRTTFCHFPLVSSSPVLLQPSKWRLLCPIVLVLEEFLALTMSGFLACYSTEPFLWAFLVCFWQYHLYGYINLAKELDYVIRTHGSDSFGSLALDICFVRRCRFLAKRSAFRRYCTVSREMGIAKRTYITSFTGTAPSWI